MMRRTGARLATVLLACVLTGLSGLTGTGAASPTSTAGTATTGGPSATPSGGPTDPAAGNAATAAPTTGTPRPAHQHARPHADRSPEPATGQSTGTAGRPPRPARTAPHLPAAPPLPRIRQGTATRTFFGPANANTSAIVTGLAAGRSPSSLGLTTTATPAAGGSSNPAANPADPANPANPAAPADDSGTTITGGQVQPGQPRYTVDSSRYTNAPGLSLLTLSQCRAHGSGPYDKDRFGACTSYTVFFWTTTCLLGTCSTANLGFRDTVLAWGSGASRTIQFQHYLDQFAWLGAGEFAQIAINMTCTPRGVGECHPDHPSVTGMALDWSNAEASGAPQAVFQMTSDPAQADTGRPEKVTFATAGLSFTFDGDAATTTPQAFPYNFRYDTTSYLSPGNTAGGVVFAGAVPTLTFDRSDSLITQNASHIYDALYHPQFTTPTWAAGTKHIPGRGADPDGFLTRLDPTLKGANRDASCSDAAKLLYNPPDYGVAGRSSCDEFPFATTDQGAAATAGTATPEFSVRLISAADNSAAGNRLNIFYAYEHILIGDPFAVDAIGDPPHTGPFPVVNVPAGGSFRTAWDAAGGAGGPLGTANYFETYLPGGQFQTFTGGVIAWSPPTGTHTVTGAIATEYFTDSGPSGALGYPTGEPYPIGAGTGQDFTHGTIYTSPTGTYRVMHVLLDTYLSNGGPTGPIGFPVAEAVSTGGGTLQEFQSGRIVDSGGSVTLSRWVVGHAAHAGDDYPYETIGQFEHQDEGTDAWNEYYGQCDSFAAWKVYENLAGSATQHPPAVPAPGWTPTNASISPVNQFTWGNADVWGAKFAALGYRVDNVPTPGAVVWWPNATADAQDGNPPDPVHGIGAVGHVGYVTDVYPDGSITVEQYNMRVNGEYSVVHISYGSPYTDVSFGLGAFTVPWPGGFVHVADGPSGAASPPEPADGVVHAGYPSGVTVIGPGSPASEFSTADVWFQRPGHGEIGQELYTHTNGATAVSTATWTPAGLAANTCYRVDAFVPDNFSDNPVAVYAVTDSSGTAYAAVDENEQTNDWSELGVFETNGGGTGLSVRLDDRGQTGLYVAADAVRFWRQAGCGQQGDASPIMMPSSYSGTWSTQPGHSFFGTEHYSPTTGTGTPSRSALWSPDGLVSFGCYDVSVYVPDNFSDNPAASYWSNDSYYGPFTEQVNETAYTNGFAGIGTLQAWSDGTLPVELFDDGPAGDYVAADAVAFVLNPHCTAQNGGANAFGSLPSDSLLGPGSPTTRFSTTGTWYYRLGHGFSDHELYTTDGSGATATWTFTGAANSCYSVDAYVPDNFANNLDALYQVSSSVVGGGGTVDQSDTTGWTPLATLGTGPDGRITVTLDATGDPGRYTAADGVSFTPTEC
ncbi:MAG TPA: CHAP domain-containing protein [Mycobacteriales bacterium]|nr:CHAP domain-containing protein [Mycobacteriales bacterium]